MENNKTTPDTDQFKTPAGWRFVQILYILNSNKWPYFIQQIHDSFLKHVPISTHCKLGAKHLYIFQIRINPNPYYHEFIVGKDTDDIIFEVTSKSKFNMLPNTHTNFNMSFLFDYELIEKIQRFVHHTRILQRHVAYSRRRYICLTFERKR